MSKWGKILCTVCVMVLFVVTMAVNGFAEKKKIDPRMEKMEAKPMQRLKSIDLRVDVVDTQQCLCLSDLSRINVMAPSRVRVKVVNDSSHDVPVKLDLTFKRVNKPEENLVRFFTMRAGEVKWVSYWNTPILFVKAKGITATISVTGGRTDLRDTNMANNSVVNTTCSPYVE